MKLSNRPFEELIQDRLHNRITGSGLLVQNAAGPTATLRIYDEIGFFGVTADDVARALDEVTADELEVQISSLGGDVFDGVAIYNALRAHPARITTRVDSMAASIASVIAQAGDRRVMLTGSQMMVHEAWGVAIGNAGDMRDLAEILDKQTDIIAGIYAESAGDGRSKPRFKSLMTAETWMDASEAVEAGLADEVVKPASAPENRWHSSFSDRLDAAVAGIEKVIEEAGAVSESRSSQGKAPLSDDAQARVERMRAALSKLVGVPDEAENGETETEGSAVDDEASEDAVVDARLDVERLRHEWQGRKYERSGS